jgi:DNA segregation ATPase FtsK/SpoIIIE-like protein
VSKRGFVRGLRKRPPSVPPARVAVAAPLALPEREPRNILLMIAIPALLVGIIGTLVVMYTSGVRSLQSGFFPMVGLVGFGAMMFSGRMGRGRKISWGEQEKQRRVYLRQLDEDRDEVQRAAQDQRRSQLFVHGDPQSLDNVIGGPRMWERRPADADFLDVRLGIGVQQASESAVSLQWPEVPVGEELEPVTGRALRDFILEQSKIRGIGKVLNLRSKPGFSFTGDDVGELHSFIRSVLCSLAVYHSPGDLKLMVVTRHPELWSWLVWLPHNQHDEMFDACGLRRLVFISPTDLEEALDAELHRKGRGPWAPPTGSSPLSMPSPADALAGSTLGPHWVIVDDNVGTPEQWEFYSLVERHHDGRPDMIGMEAVNQLLVALEVHRFDFCFIGAGYEKEVDEFLTVNRGLAGRFNRKLRFESYSPGELVEIAVRYGQPRATVIEPPAQEAMNAACRVLRAYHAPNGSHGVDVMQNGRFSRNVVERAERLRDSRVAAQNRMDRGSVTITDLETIRTQDLVTAISVACAEKNVPVQL